jgi:hypothetical protein
VIRACPECGGVLTSLDDVKEYASARGRFLCSECQTADVLDATNELREDDDGLAGGIPVGR